MEMLPCLLAGMGHVELLYGNKTDSRQRFETAISLTKEKDINVLNAVAYANVDAKAGDANYAIQKLNSATQIKRFNDPETYILMGDAYRRLAGWRQCGNKLSKSTGSKSKNGRSRNENRYHLPDTE